jgi:hypothetical protein
VIAPLSATLLPLLTALPCALRTAEGACRRDIKHQKACVVSTVVSTVWSLVVS